MKSLLNQLGKVVDQLQNHQSNHLCKKNHDAATASAIKLLCSLGPKHREHLKMMQADLESPEKFNRQIRLYQSTLIHQLNRIYESNTTCLLERDESSCIKTITTQILMDLLCFLRQQFPHAFDVSLKLPASVYEMQKEQFQRALLTNHSILISKGINRFLLKTVTHPISDFINHKKEYYTYCDVSYLHAWSGKLTEMTKKPHTGREINKLISTSTLEHDLNSSPCYDYFVEYMAKAYRMQNTLSDQLVTLNYYLKCVNQVTVTGNLNYDPTTKKLKSSLSNWLKEEIRYIENSCHINDQPTFNQEKPIKRIPTNLPVTQLAFYIRLWVKTQILPNKNKAELITLFSRLFSSIDQPQISFKSLNNKFYEPDPSSVDKVEKMLEEQLELIRQNKF